MADFSYSECELPLMIYLLFTILSYFHGTYFDYWKTLFCFWQCQTILLWNFSWTQHLILILFQMVLPWNFSWTWRFTFSWVEFKYHNHQAQTLYISKLACSTILVRTTLVCICFICTFIFVLVYLRDSSVSESSRVVVTVSPPSPIYTPDLPISNR